MDQATSRQALEAILFIVDEPVTASTLSEVLEASQAEIEAELVALATELEEERRGFVLRNVAGGWRFYTAPDAAPYLERWVRGRRSGRLSQASLETLAVVAYKQPVSRAEVAEIRGVNADGTMRTLLARGLIGEVGRDSGPGQAVLYGTTARFLEDLGINSLADLPPLKDFLPTGPAPDEPAPEHRRAARAAIRAGLELPSTGKARWEPKLDAADTDAPAQPLDDEIGSTAEDHVPGVPTPHAILAPPRERDGELDALTEALDRATRNAIAVLENALRVVDAPTVSSDLQTSAFGVDELGGQPELNATACEQEDLRAGDRRSGLGFAKTVTEAGGPDSSGSELSEEYHAHGETDG